MTHPDYMHPEYTLLHGYHRTSWVEWPEKGFPMRWSDGYMVEVPPKSKVKESLPRTERQPELPPPQAEAPNATAPPDAAAPHSVATAPPAEAVAERWSEAMERQRRAEASLRANQAAAARRAEHLQAAAAAIVEQIERAPMDEAIPVAYEVAPEHHPPSAGEMKVEEAMIADEPADVTETEVRPAIEADVNLSALDAGWVTRLSDLVATDRKQRWTTVQDVEPPPLFRQTVDEVAPCESPSDELSTPASSIKGGAAQLSLRTAAKKPPPRGMPAARQTVNQSRVTLKPATPTAKATTGVITLPTGTSDIRLKVADPQSSTPTK